MYVIHLRFNKAVKESIMGRVQTRQGNDGWMRGYTDESTVIKCAQGRGRGDLQYGYVPSRRRGSEHNQLVGFAMTAALLREQGKLSPQSELSTSRLSCPPCEERSHLQGASGVPSVHASCAPSSSTPWQPNMSGAMTLL